MKFKQDDILDGLKDIAHSLGIKIRKERGVFTEGLCKLNNEQIILINTLSPPERVINIVAIALDSIGLDNLYIKPFLREVIDNETGKNDIFKQNNKVK
ncbi:MAG: hypothetical protein KIT33_03870 [Candidatus Kapabacteria bacterium]|nr:hypothetical protein [Ignavibacteriota bacterium]MCW5884091.1 hypothetical protein [Candidatus Kapabacteria bacterium]